MMPAFQFWRKLGKKKKNEGYNVIWSGWQYQQLQVPLQFCSLTYNTSVKAINMYRYSFLNSLQQAKTSKSYVSKRQVRAVACKANNILLPTCGVGIHISHPSASIIPAPSRPRDPQAAAAAYLCREADRRARCSHGEREVLEPRSSEELAEPLFCIKIKSSPNVMVHPNLLRKR